MAMERRWIVTQDFRDEGESSETLDRPALQQLVAAIEADEVDRLLVYSIDRLTRRLVDLQVMLELFDKHGVELAVVTDPTYDNSAASRLATNIVAAASQFQQEINRQRMADARAALKQKGKRVAGRVPFGYRAEPRTMKLIPHQDQQRIVCNFFRLAADGIRPSDLANLANLNGWKDQDAETGKWTARRITALLKNPTYAGLIRNGESLLPGEHRSIVSGNLFDAVQQQLAGRRTRKPQRHGCQRQDNPFGVNLQGLLICGQCNRPMSTSVSQRGPIRYVYYRCRSTAGGRKPCPGVSVSVYEIERFLCGVPGDVDHAESVIPHEFRIYWGGLDELEQRGCLRRVIHRVTYDHAAGKIRATWRNDWRSAIGGEGR